MPSKLVYFCTPVSSCSFLTQMLTSGDAALEQDQCNGTASDGIHGELGMPQAAGQQPWQQLPGIGNNLSLLASGIRTESVSRKLRAVGAVQSPMKREDDATILATPSMHYHPLLTV